MNNEGVVVAENQARTYLVCRSSDLIIIGRKKLIEVEKGTVESN